MNKACLLLGLLAVPALGQDANRLPDRWKAWLERDVAPIITAKEREVFLALQSEKEREIFAEGFWLQRDPTPGTPANEFKDEHFRRLKHADEYYGRSSMKTGRETDRGRMYVLLGEPISIQRFEEGAQNLNPCELWQYQGDASLGMPPFFYLLFFKRDPNSDYTLYSPSMDGPNRLLQGAFQGSYDRQSAYEELKNASGELAEASLTLIPGTAGDASSTSSLSSDLLLARIHSLPEKRAKSDWAVAFAKNSEIITTDHSVNYLPADSTLFVHQAADGGSVLHALIEPRRLSMFQYEDKTYAPLKLNIKVAGRGRPLVHQEEKSISIEVGQSDFANIARRVVAVGDVLPLVEGTFEMSYLLRNTESKEFSSIEGTVRSPESGAPSLSPLLVLYDVKPAPQDAGTAPFVFGDHKLFPSANRTLAKGEPLRIYAEIYNPDEAALAGTLRWSIDDESANVFTGEEAVAGRRYILKTFSAGDIQPGYYALSLSVVDAGGRVLMTNSEQFAVSPAAALPRPWRFDRLYPPPGHPYYTMIRAYEYLGLGEPSRAAAILEPVAKAIEPNVTVSLLLARAYFDMKDDARAVAALEPVRAQDNAEANLLLGKALYRLGRYEEALPALEFALRTIGQSVELLNLIGTSCLKLGRTDQGLPYLRRSLEMNANQPEIRRAVEAAGKAG